MSDEELIKRLRAYAQIEHAAAAWGFAGEGEVMSRAADRIEALVNEAILSKAAYEGVSSLLLSVQQDCIKERQRAERLEALAEHAFAEGFAEGNDGGWVEGDYNPAWRKSVTLAALKGADHE